MHCTAGDSFFSPIPLAQLLTVLCCTLCVPWKAQLRVSLLPRALMKVSGITFGIPSWSHHFMCRLAASSNSLRTKSIWRELHFPVILLCDKEGPTIPHDAQAGTTACCQHPLWYGIIQDYAGGYAAPASVVEKSRQCLASLLRPWMSTWRLRQRCSQHLHQL